VKVPHIPENESRRLAALAQYSILDSPTEAAFDGLTKLAAHICDVPIALISFPDTNRLWFKARFGLDVEEMPRSVSLCAHVVADNAPLIVPDTHLDARFKDNSVVTGLPNVRFYAGVPLVSPDGTVIGSLCAIDRVPRQPTPEQIAALELLADQVVYLLEKRRIRLQAMAEREEARQNVQRLEVLFDAMAEGVVVQDNAGSIVSSNIAASEILGLTAEQMLGLTSVDPRWQCVREDVSPFPGDEHPAMVALRTSSAQRNVVMGVQKPDGALTWISINSVPSASAGDGGSHEVVTTFHDISQLKLASERLAQQDRLVMTGTLVAGVGHEINNPLAFVMGNIDLALEELRAMSGLSPSARLSDLLDMLGEARVGADRIRRIVRGLRALSREDFALQPIELEPVVETSISMALHELRLTATVSVELVGLPPVLADESRLTQVLVNLLVNAAQAFETADPTRNRIVVRGCVMPDGRVRLSVADNGPGVPLALASRIFDPFFTTKPVGEGTGLGLAVSGGIVLALGGELTLESTPGMGATFHVTLKPAHTRTADVRPDAVIGAGPRGQILVIDDDNAVLATLSRVLSREHDIVALDDPRVAQAMLESGRPFDVIFCDIMMPHISGEALYKSIHASNPDLADRFVFITGGATRASIRAFLAKVSNDVIEKPFVMQDLLAMARRNVLRRHGG